MLEANKKMFEMFMGDASEELIRKVTIVLAVSGFSIHILLWALYETEKIVKEVKSSRGKIQSPNFEVLSRTKEKSSETAQTCKRKPLMWRSTQRGLKAKKKFRPARESNPESSAP